MHRMNHGLRLAALLATAAWLGGASGAWAAGPGITLDPNENHPQGNTQVRGTGFGAYEAVDIYFDSTDEALAIADVNGAFAKIPIPVPAAALPGAHYITAVQRSNGEGAQKAFTVNTDWAQFHFNEKRRGLNPWENVVAPNNVASLDVAWTFTTGAAVDSSPAVAGGIVYVASTQQLYALDATTGAMIWSYETGASITSAPAVSNGVVYVGSGNLYALNATTGAQLWYDQLPYGTNSSPTVANGAVYIGDLGGNVWAFNAQNGSAFWRSVPDGGASYYASPAVSNGVVYVGADDSKLSALNATNGNLLWSAATAGIITSSAAVANGVVYVGSGDHNLYAWNAATGAPLWIDLTGAEVDSSPAVANGVVYVGSFDNNLYAFNATTGAPLWNAVTGNSIDSSPAVANGMVYVGSRDANVYAYALNGGNNAVYRNKRKPPAISSLHPDWNLKPAN